MILVRHYLTDIYTPSRKKCPIQPNFYIAFNTESPFRPAVASPKICLFLTTRKVKKTAPELSKTIVAIKRNTDSLYTLFIRRSILICTKSPRKKTNIHVKYTRPSTFLFPTTPTSCSVDSDWRKFYSDWKRGSVYCNRRTPKYEY